MVVNIRPLCAALAERARVELNEQPNEIEARINDLREWILQQPHLKARTGESPICHDQNKLTFYSLSLFLAVCLSHFDISLQTISSWCRFYAAANMT